ncbi:MAG: class I SAM-dependent methyltransferase [Bacteroidota bacterium]
MQQDFDKLLMFRNRLQKVYKHLSKLAKKQGITCYRLYNHDLPEAPFIIEVYEDKLYVSEYQRRHSLTEERHEAWLNESVKVMTEVSGIAQENIFIKTRRRKQGRLDQYQKLNEDSDEIVVQENGLQFLVNLSDYLDTGLFLDHRITRQMVKEMCNGKKMLNLFCYTGSFSVYAAAGGATEVVSVDLSKTYLAWAERNMLLNFPTFSNHQLLHADVKQHLKDLPANYFDLIVMDPPTFSNSKRMDDVLDIQRDHVELINDCIRSLTVGGCIIFSTNYTRFQMDNSNILASSITEITKATTSFDFVGKINRYCFRVHK